MVFSQLAKYYRSMFKTIPLIVAVTASAFAGGSDKEQAKICNLEKAYWEYVKTNDLEKYRALWHENFLGWPFVNPAPVRKDHITDWITANTSKGISLQFFSVEQLAIQVTSDTATDYYRIKVTWANSSGAEVKTDSMRIT